MFAVILKSTENHQLILILKSEIMKTSLALIFSLVLLMPINAQEKLKDILPLINSKVTYTNIITVDNVSKDEIYNRAKHWLAYNYDRFKIDSKDELICQGHITVGYAQIWQTVTIKIKDGRYKYEVTNFQVVMHDVSNGSSMEVDAPLEKYHSLFGIGEKTGYKNIDNQISELIESLEEAIKTEKVDNW